MTGTGGRQFSFEEADGLVYFCNGVVNGIYGQDGFAVAAWGTPPPEPAVLAVSPTGGLQPGTYAVSLATLDASGNLSGASNPVSITLQTAGGIIVANGAGKTVWVTQCNGTELYLAGSGMTHIGGEPSAEKLLTLFCEPPPILETICYAFGRMWGAKETKIYYSQPYRPDLFRHTFNVFEFNDAVRVIARTDGGLYIGCDKATYYLAGTEPEKMKLNAIGAGSIAGSLCYVESFPDLGSKFNTEEMVINSIPVWLTLDGLVAGTDGGRLFNLTANKVRIDPAEGARAATFARWRDGHPQIGTRFQTVGIGDEVECQVIRNGKVITE
jgi:hypothetical protein